MAKKNKYSVTLHGKGFIFNHDGEQRAFGFHATRYVEAESPEAAGKIAVVRIHQSSEFSSNLSNEGTTHPSIDIGEVKEVGALRFFFKKSKKAFQFYSEDDE